MKILFLAWLLLFFSCSYKVQFGGPCTKENIEAQCEYQLKKKFGLITYNVADKDSFYLITFRHRQPNSRGASGYIEVSKKDCSIIDQQFYQ